MEHKVSSVQMLHDDAYSLYTNVVIGGSEYSADSIIANLNAGIENLKNTWKGKDAGVQIQNVVQVHNAMVAIRNTLAELARTTSKISADYREIQNSNGAGLESFSVLSTESRSVLSDYVDNADTIDIVAEANAGKQKIDSANNSIASFISETTKYYNDIMNNWTAGPDRGTYTAAFEEFINKSKSYESTLDSVSESIRTALANYGL
jgi:uncharacterized protein YukE